MILDFFKLHKFMKNNNFFMATCLLAVWRHGDCKSYSAITWLSGDGDDYKTYLFSNNTDGLEVILNIFGDKDIDFEKSTIYITKIPSQMFLKAAKQKSVEKVVFIKNIKNYVVADEFFGFAEPFNGSFGKLIDMFSQYETNLIQKHKYLL